MTNKSRTNSGSHRSQVDATRASLTIRRTEVHAISKGAGSHRVAIAAAVLIAALGAVILIALVKNLVG
jgi:hypothetical protein